MQNGYLITSYVSKWDWIILFSLKIRRCIWAQTHPFLQWPFTVQKKGMIALQGVKGVKCYSYWSKISQKFHWLISKISWLLFSDLCASISWGWAICFKNWHTLALAWLSISSTVDECWLQTLMLVFSCIFFSYSRTSSIVISVKSSKLLAFSTDSNANLIF